MSYNEGVAAGLSCCAPLERNTTDFSHLKQADHVGKSGQLSAVSNQP